MSTVAEIESAIEKLSPQDQSQVRDWILERESQAVPVMEKLRKLAGTVHDWPPDMAINHDHYLHGAAKRSEE